MIDWTNPDCNITQNFKVKEAITLHHWNRLADESDGLDDQMKENLIKTCEMMEKIRSFLGIPLNIHCMFRSEDYNKLIGAPVNDPHSRGQAADYDGNPDISCDEIKVKLMSQLDPMSIRMEDNGHGASWVHCDWSNVIYHRFFKP